jgi:hypothetical protein
MAQESELARALATVQQVIGSSAFLALAGALNLSRDPAVISAAQEDVLARLREHEIALLPLIQEINFRRRHPTTAGWERGGGWQNGGQEWRFYIQPAEVRYRVSVIAEPWTLPTPQEREQEEH